MIRVDKLVGVLGPGHVIFWGTFFLLEICQEIWTFCNFPKTVGRNCDFCCGGNRKPKELS